MREHLKDLPWLIAPHADLKLPRRHVLILSSGQGMESSDQVDIAQGLQHVRAELVQVLQSQRFALADSEFLGDPTPERGMFHLATAAECSVLPSSRRSPPGRLPVCPVCSARS